MATTADLWLIYVTHCPFKAKYLRYVKTRTKHPWQRYSLDKNFKYIIIFSRYNHINMSIYEEGQFLNYEKQCDLLRAR